MHNKTEFYGGRFYGKIFDESDHFWTMITATNDQHDSQLVSSMVIRSKVDKRELTFSNIALSENAMMFNYHFKVSNVLYF